MPIAEHQMPACPLMRAAWAGCPRWALGKDEILATFRAETGENWAPGRSPLDRMIDDAIGAGEAFMSRFVDWFNANVWGDLSEAAFDGVEIPNDPAPRPRADGIDSEGGADGR